MFFVTDISFFRGKLKKENLFIKARKKEKEKKKKKKKKKMTKKKKIHGFGLLFKKFVYRT